MIEHINKEHGKIAYQCKICNMIVYKMRAKYHKENECSNRGGPTYQCDRCHTYVEIDQKDYHDKNECAIQTTKPFVFQVLPPRELRARNTCSICNQQVVDINYHQRLLHPNGINAERKKCSLKS
jgi:hypothetical protein